MFSVKRLKFPRRLLGNFLEEVGDAMLKLTLPDDANIYHFQYQLYLPSKEDLKKRLMEWAEAALQSESGGR